MNNGDFIGSINILMELMLPIPNVPNQFSEIYGPTEVPPAVCQSSWGVGSVLSSHR